MMDRYTPSSERHMMPEVYLHSELTQALIRNLDVYLEQGEIYREGIRAHLANTQTKEEAIVLYHSLVKDFKDAVYCEIVEDYSRMTRYEDILQRWEKSASKPRRREALERLIITFDLNNYTAPVSMGFFS